MSRVIHRLLAATGLAAVTLTAALTTATAANAATGVELRETVPTTSISGTTVTVSAVKTNPTAAAKNYTFTATVGGQAITFDATNGGSFAVKCGQSWTLTEQRNRSIDYFVVGGSQVAAVSYSDVAPPCAVQLQQIAPTTSISGTTVTISVAKTNPSSGLQNYSFYAYINGQPITFNASTGGTFTATCGQSWNVTEQRNRSQDFFLVGNTHAAAVSYADVAPAC